MKSNKRSTYKGWYLGNDFWQYCMATKLNHNRPIVPCLCSNAVEERCRRKILLPRISYDLYTICLTILRSLLIYLKLSIICQQRLSVYFIVSWAKTPRRFWMELFYAKIKKLYAMRAMAKTNLLTIYFQGILPSVLYAILIWG